MINRFPNLKKLFFFSSRRRHTIWPRDWSSDVCSSDLSLRYSKFLRRLEYRKEGRMIEVPLVDVGADLHAAQAQFFNKIGRASCRESVDLGGRQIVKKKKSKNLNKDNDNR